MKLFTEWPQQCPALLTPQITHMTEHINSWATALQHGHTAQLSHHQLLLQLRVVRSQTSWNYSMKTSSHFDPISNLDTFGSVHPSPTLADGISIPQMHFYRTMQLVETSGVPQTRQQISAASGPKFATLYRHLGEILLFNKFFFRLSIRASVAKI